VSGVKCKDIPLNGKIKKKPSMNLDRGQEKLFDEKTGDLKSWHTVFSSTSNLIIKFRLIFYS
jgi:hypothetical protein